MTTLTDPTRTQHDTPFAQQAEELRQQWLSGPRWAGVERRYSAEDVVRLRGSVVEEHTLARRGAERLWEAMRTRPFVRSLGALTGNQAVQQVRAGLESQTDPAQLDEPMASSKTVEQQPVEPVEPLTSDPAEGSHETESNGTEPDGQSVDGDGGPVDEVVGDVVVTAPVNAPVTTSCNNVSVLSDESSADCAGADQDNGQGAASGSTLRTWMGLPEQPYGFVKAMRAKYDKY